MCANFAHVIFSSNSPFLKIFLSPTKNKYKSRPNNYTTILKFLITYEKNQKMHAFLVKEQN